MTYCQTQAGGAVFAVVCVDLGKLLKQSLQLLRSNSHSRVNDMEADKSTRVGLQSIGLQLDDTRLRKLASIAWKKVFACVANTGQRFRALLVVVMLGVLVQHFRNADDCIQWRSPFVAHAGEKPTFCRRCLLRLGLRLAKFRFGLPSHRDIGERPDKSARRQRIRPHFNDPADLS